MFDVLLYDLHMIGGWILCTSVYMHIYIQITHVTYVYIYIYFFIHVYAHGAMSIDLRVKNDGGRACGHTRTYMYMCHIYICILYKFLCGDHQLVSHV